MLDFWRFYPFYPLIILGELDEFPRWDQIFGWNLNFRWFCFWMRDAQTPYFCWLNHPYVFHKFIKSTTSFCGLNSCWIPILSASIPKWISYKSNSSRCFPRNGPKFPSSFHPFCHIFPQHVRPFTALHRPATSSEMRPRRTLTRNSCSSAVISAVTWLEAEVSA